MVRGSKESLTVYDGPLRDPTAPPGAYFRVHPESDAMVFPFSRYPKTLAGGSPIRILQLDMEMVHSMGYRMFFVAATRSQASSLRTERVQCHVVFAVGEDSEICSKLMPEMDIHNNQILQRNRATKGTLLENKLRLPHSVFMECRHSTNGAIR